MLAHGVEQEEIAETLGLEPEWLLARRWAMLAGAAPAACQNAGMPTRDQVLEALKVVIDPELHRSIVELGMVRSIDISEQGVVDVTVSLTTPGCPIKSHFQTGVARRCAASKVSRASTSASTC